MKPESKQGRARGANRCNDAALTLLAVAGISRVSQEVSRLSLLCLTCLRTSSVNLSRSTSGADTSRTELTKARTSQPATSRRIFLAMAPAATRPMVSRALERPPPATARTPYFIS